MARFGETKFSNLGGEEKGEESLTHCGSNCDWQWTVGIDILLQIDWYVWELVQVISYGNAKQLISFEDFLKIYEILDLRKLVVISHNISDQKQMYVTF